MSLSGCGVMRQNSGLLRRDPDRLPHRRLAGGGLGRGVSVVIHPDALIGPMTEEQGAGRFVEPSGRLGLPDTAQRPQLPRTGGLRDGRDPRTAITCIGQRLARSTGKRLGPAAWPSTGADGRHGTVRGAPPESPRHGHPLLASGAEERLGLGDLGVRRLGRPGGAYTRGDQDGSASGLRNAVVSGVEKAGPHTESPGAKDLCVLTPQRQDIGYLLHGHPLRLTDRMKGVEIAHGLGSQQRPLILAGGEELFAGVAAGSEGGDRFVHQGLVQQAEPFTGHRPCLARRTRDEPAGSSDKWPRGIRRHVGAQRQLPCTSTGLTGPGIPFQADIACSEQ